MINGYDLLLFILVLLKEFLDDLADLDNSFYLDLMIFAGTKRHPESSEIVPLVE